MGQTESSATRLPNPSLILSILTDPQNHAVLTRANSELLARAASLPPTAAAPRAKLDVSTSLYTPLCKAALLADPSLSAILATWKRGGEDAFWSEYFSRILELHAASLAFEDKTLPSNGMQPPLSDEGLGVSSTLAAITTPPLSSSNDIVPLADALSQSTKLCPASIASSGAETIPPDSGVSRETSSSPTSFPSTSAVSSTVSSASPSSTTSSSSPSLGLTASAPTVTPPIASAVAASATASPSNLPRASPVLSSNAPPAEEEEDQNLLLPGRDCYIYRIPPRPSASGYRASEWGLEKPLLTAYVRVVAVGEREVVVAIWQRPEQKEESSRITNGSSSSTTSTGIKAVSAMTLTTANAASPLQSKGIVASTASSLSSPAAASKTAAAATAALKLGAVADMLTSPSLSGHVLIAAGRIPIVPMQSTVTGTSSLTPASTASSSSSSSFPSSSATKDGTLASGGDTDAYADGNKESLGRGCLEKPLSHYLEPVIDSSRYFVLRISRQGAGSGASSGSGVGANAAAASSSVEGLLGIGFADRQHAFDLNSCLSDHISYIDRQRRASARAAADHAQGGDAAEAFDPFSSGASIPANNTTGSKEGQLLSPFSASAFAGLSIPAGKKITLKIPGGGGGGGGGRGGGGKEGEGSSAPTASNVISGTTAAAAAAAAAGVASPLKISKGLLAPPPPPPSSAAALSSAASTATALSASAISKTSGALPGKEEDDEWGEFTS